MVDDQLTRRAMMTAMTAAAAASGGYPALAQAEGLGVRAVEARGTSESVIACGGGRMRVLVEGEGRPLVMLHKLGGWAADWRFVAPLLSRRRKLVIMDLPGHGGSTMYGPAPYAQTVAESAAMVMAAVQAVGVTQFDLAGCSLGGVIGVEMAAFWPGAVRRLVLLSVALTDAKSREALRQQEAAAPATGYGPHDEPIPRSAEQAARFGSFDPRINDEMNESRAVAGRWVRASERGVSLAGAGGYLDRVQCPTLLIYGSAGDYRQYEAMARARLKDVRTTVIARSGAFTPQDQPGPTAEAIEAFLA